MTCRLRRFQDTLLWAASASVMAAALSLTGDRCFAVDENTPTPEILNAQDVKRLPREQAALEPSVKLRGVVSCRPQGWKGFFLQDETGGIYCEAADAEAETGFWPVFVGEEILLEGMAAEGDLNTFVRVRRIPERQPSVLPKTELRSIDSVVADQIDADLVRIRGHIVRMVNIAGQMQYSIHGDQFGVRVVHDGFRIDPRVEDFAEVEVSGIVIPQRTEGEDAKIMVPALDCVTLLRTHVKVLEETRNVPISQLLKPDVRQGQVTRIRGTVFGQSESTFWLTNSDAGIECRFKPGERPTGTVLEVLGSLQVQGTSRWLDHAVLVSEQSTAAEFPLRFPRLESGLPMNQLASLDGRFLDQFVADGQLTLSFQTSAGRLQCRLLNTPPTGELFLQYGATYEIQGLLIPASAGRYSVSEMLVRSKSHFRKTAEPPWPADVAISLVTALTVCLSGGLFASWRLYRRANIARLRLEAIRVRLHMMNDQLEERVLERTQELQQTNQRLTEEVVSRQVAESEALSAVARMEEAQAIAQVGSFSLQLPSEQMVWSVQAFRLHGTAPAPPGPVLSDYIAQVHADDRSSVLHFLQTAAESDRQMKIRFRYPGKITPWSWISCSARRAPEAATHDALTIEGTFQDITELVATEERVRQSLKMDAIGRLAGGVAHDLNNTLTAILLNCHLLDSMSDLQPAVSQHLSMIENAAEKSAMLTRQLLMFSRKQAIHPRLLSISAAVRNFLPLLRQFVGESVTIRTELTDSIARVRLDSGQLEQILLNLVINARDAMQGKGEILVATQLVTVSGSELDSWVILPPPGDYVVLSMQDSGSGIAPQILNSIFDPFFTTKASGGGTGLGLAVVHGIVQQNSGGIRVFSQLGTGTRFEVLFPVCPASSEDPAGKVRNDTENSTNPPSEAGPLVPGHGSVLLVDDEEMVLRQTSRALSHLGYTVCATTSASEAIHLAETGSQFDILITDYDMPEFTGLQLINRLRTSRPDIRTLLMSGFLNEETFLSLHSPIETAYIQKPFGLSGLSIAVSRLLQDSSVPTSQFPVV